MESFVIGLFLFCVVMFLFSIIFVFNVDFLNLDIFEFSIPHWKRFLRKYLPEYDEASLKKELIRRFYYIQIAWMNFDYPTLRQLCSPEIYESYRSDLEVLSDKHEKNVMNEFTIYDSDMHILKMYKEDNQIIVRTFLSATFRDYIVSSLDGDIVHGNEGFICPNYILEFHIILDDKEVYCPNCGAPLKDSICKYCHTEGLNYQYGIVLYKKGLAPRR